MWKLIMILFTFMSVAVATFFCGFLIAGQEENMALNHVYAHPQYTSEQWSHSDSLCGTYPRQFLEEVDKTVVKCTITPTSTGPYADTRAIDGAFLRWQSGHPEYQEYRNVLDKFDENANFARKVGKTLGAIFGGCALVIFGFTWLRYADIRDKQEEETREAYIRHEQSAWGSHFAEKVRNRTIDIGMTEKMVTTAKGSPSDVESEVTAYGTQRIWIYPSMVITFMNGRVTRIQMK
jgi:hypothetical protein